MKHKKGSFLQDAFRDNKSTKRFASLFFLLLIMSGMSALTMPGTISVILNGTVFLGYVSLGSFALYKIIKGKYRRRRQ